MAFPSRKSLDSMRQRGMVMPMWPGRGVPCELQHYLKAGRSTSVSGWRRFQLWTDDAQPTVDISRKDGARRSGLQESLPSWWRTLHEFRTRVAVGLWYWGGTRFAIHDRVCNCSLGGTS